MEEELHKLIQKYLPNDAAKRFVYAFCNLCHTIDDLIDENASPERILRAFAECVCVFSSTYYLANGGILFPLVINIVNTYADSVKWEKEEELWKKYYSDVLRGSGNDMIMCVVNLESGYDKMREVSILLREYSYKKHHTEHGEII